MMNLPSILTASWAGHPHRFRSSCVLPIALHDAPLYEAIAEHYATPFGSLVSVQSCSVMLSSVSHFRSNRHTSPMCSNPPGVPTPSWDASCSRYTRIMSWISPHTLSFALIGGSFRCNSSLRVLGSIHLPRNQRTCCGDHLRHNDRSGSTPGRFRGRITENRKSRSVRSCATPFRRTDCYFLAAVRKSRLEMFSNGNLASVGIDNLLTAVLTLPEIPHPQFVGRLFGGLPVHPCHFEELKSVLLRPHLAITLHAYEHVLPSFSFEVWLALISDDRRAFRLGSAPLGLPAGYGCNPKRACRTFGISARRVL